MQTDVLHQAQVAASSMLGQAQSAAEIAGQKAREVLATVGHQAEVVGSEIRAEVQGIAETTKEKWDQTVGHTHLGGTGEAKLLVQNRIIITSAC